ncbi:tryptophan halogenase family protein [Sphingomicrobium sp. XHP0235]|uniref:tryptophan halogenase family protein n=1 Tax=Sphingomicrobium aquimarinum TaxID=3133971 RepID=UPI0031FED73A
MAREGSMHILIAGGGTAGWMSAAALARFAPPGYRISLVESEAIGTVGVGEATIPQIHLFNAALGFDEAEFLAATKGSFKLGIEFDGWGAPDSAYMHAFGAIGRGMGVVPFHHYWLRAKAEGIAKPLQRYSMNELAARTMRVQPGGMAANGPELPYAYHFDAGLYAAYLRRYAEARGVIRHEGRIASVGRHGETGDIAALTLEDGRSLEADFFIDCTGFRALLIEGALEAGFEDWTRWLPCDRAIAVPCSSGGDFTPYTKAIAREAGWQWRIPLQHRIGNGYVYSSAHLSDDEAAATLLANLDGKAQADPRPIRFTTGKRKKQWVGNCLAIGLSAGFLEPMESTSIHLIQSAISRLLALLPGETRASAAADHFNAQADFEWSRIRDFLILHYHANGREGQPFWDALRTMDVPDSLAEKLALWRGAGHIHREHEELFTEVGWFQVFAGQGVEATRYNQIADSLATDDLGRQLEDIERGCIDHVKRLPRHLEALQEMLATTGEAA